MTAFTIRPVRPQDAPVVLALLHSAHAWNLANGFNFTAADITLDALQPRLTPGTFFVAESEGRLLGTIEVKPEASPPDWGFHLLAVQSGDAARGVGRALVAHAEALALAAGAPRLMMDTPANHPWLPAYYANLGYEPIGTVTWDGKWYESVLMAKALS